ncbi:MAG: hypothetical protein ACJ8D0_25615 [Xanthobacteraceae bacterium]
MATRECSDWDHSRFYVLFIPRLIFSHRHFIRGQPSRQRKDEALEKMISMMSIESADDSADGVLQALLPAAAVACAAMLALSLCASAGDPVSPAADELIESLHACAGYVEHSARLSCYDKALAAAHPAKGATAPVLLHP